MTDVATVTLRVADVEPIASFISRVHKADAMIRGMTAQEAADLPGTVVAGITELQSAVRDLGAVPPREGLDGDG